MSSTLPGNTTPTPTTTPTTGLTPAAADLYRGILHDLILMGANMARHVHDHATTPLAPAPLPTAEVAPASHAPTPSEAPTAPPAPTPTNTPLTPALTPADLPALAVAFDRLARTVRRTILLAQHLDDPRPTQPGATRAALRHTPLTPANLATTPDHELPDHDHPTHTRPTRDHLEHPHLEHDRLDADDFSADRNRPIALLIAEIRRDLGLTPPTPTPPTQPPNPHTPGPEPNPEPTPTANPPTPPAPTPPTPPTPPRPQPPRFLRPP